MSDELQKHLDKGMYGTPQLHPEEQQHYLGTFRERCYVSMTIQQMKEKRNQALLVQAFTTYPDAKILLNGKSPESLQQTYIAIIMKYNRNFTVINGNQSADADSIGLLLVADSAVNEEILDIEQKFTKPNLTEAPQKKSGFWENLFH